MHSTPNRSDDEASTDEDGETPPPPRPTRPVPAKSQLTAADDYETVEVVHAAAHAFKRLKQHGDKGDCCVM